MVVNRITKSGFEELKRRQDKLNTELKAVAKEIGIARGFGDLSENAEYAAAKEKQAELNEELTGINALITNSEIINDDEIDTDKVSIGNRVLVYNHKTEKEIEYYIVSTKEVNVREGKISNESPIGRALIDQKEDAEIDVETPSGTVKYTVRKIMK
ncbi:MAG: transcription elongation factor GreA [Oscillospiraceae bacterium]|jgi:transcription elongation factor GreA|nr:transcription elongation factor GreA [Oscillospiraceae bacterium]